MTIYKFKSILSEVSSELSAKVSRELPGYIYNETGITYLTAVKMNPKWQALIISAFLQSKGIVMPDVCLTPFGLSVYLRVVENKMNLLKGSLDTVQHKLAM